MRTFVNNPATLTDPTGLQPTDLCDRKPASVACGNDVTSRYESDIASFEGGSCEIDGLPMGCGITFAMLESGIAAQCPNNFCSGFGPVGNGEFAFVQFNATSSQYDVIDQPFNPNMTPEQVLDALNAQLAAVIDALEAAGEDEATIKNFISAASRNYSQVTREGGNFDFPFGNTNFGRNCPQERCDKGSLGTIDFSHNNGTLHLDTADPFTDVAGLFTHGLVDVFLGNYWYQVIPRPWGF